MLTTMIMIFLVLFVLANILLLGRVEKSQISIAHPESNKHKDSGACTLSCSPNIDNVNDPAYNMKEVIKNSLLIEQHLAEKNKYCKPCIVKHFLLNQALLEEAVWMAAENFGKFPLLKDSDEFNRQLFDKWHKNMNNDEVRLEVLRDLREWRRQLIELYYF